MGNVTDNPNRFNGLKIYHNAKFIQQNMDTRHWVNQRENTIDSSKHRLKGMSIYFCAIT